MQTKKTGEFTPVAFFFLVGNVFEKGLFQFEPAFFRILAILQNEIMRTVGTVFIKKGGIMYLIILTKKFFISS